MVRAVPLDSLPPGLEFPPQLQSRIWHEPAEKKLKFDGFMSKCDFDKLVRLSNEVAYQRSLERLFQLCTFPDAPGKPDEGDGRTAWYLGFGLATLGLVAIVTVLLVVAR